MANHYIKPQLPFFITLFTIFITINIPKLIGQEKNFFWYDESLSFEVRIDSLVASMTTQEKIKQLLNDSPAIPRLGIPEYNWWNEAAHGVARNGKATIFPQSIGIAASFDIDLTHKIASAISDEARVKFDITSSQGNRGKYAGLTFWSPNINIFRDPRWGRGQETYGEDPYLTSKLGVAFVKGLQGDHPKYLKTAACAKHFAVHSGPEKLRHSFNATPSAKDLYETYLPAFKALVKEAKIEGIMGAYNAVNGEPSCASPFLLQDILTNEWGFDGYIVSDCGAIGDIFSGHNFASSLEEAAAMALQAGVNLNCGFEFSLLYNALKRGLIKEELIDERIKQLYRTRFKLGLFDSKQNNPYANLKHGILRSEANIALAKEAAQKSIVLLKNKNNALPLDKNIKAPYVTGPFAATCDVLMANYYGISPNMVTVLEGIANKISAASSLNYRKGVLPFQPNLNPLNWAPHVAAESDATICVVGITSDIEGEEVDAIASDNYGDRKSLQLPQNQIDYIKQLSEKKKGPLILVIAAGSAISLEEVEPLADAILYIWYPGEQGGNAIADIIFGDISPSGHLPITFPKNVKQLPPFEDYSMKDRTYKYMQEDPMYPFGFGLTYSTTSIPVFKVSDTEIDSNTDLLAKIEVSNNTGIEIQDVIQVYLSPVETNNTLPKYTLIHFERLSLKPNEKKALQIRFDENSFKLTDNLGKRKLIPGTYKLIVSNALPTKRSIELGSAAPKEILINIK